MPGAPAAGDRRYHRPSWRKLTVEERRPMPVEPRVGYDSPFGMDR